MIPSVPGRLRRARDGTRLRVDARDGDAEIERGRVLRLDRVPWVVLAVGLVAIAWIAWLARDLTFFKDEWTYIEARDLSWRGLFAPHNEHLVALHVLAYRILVGVAGTGSYWPYLGLTLVLHAGVAAIVYLVVRREASGGWAIGAMVLMLVFGAGGDNILWAFQSGAVAATAAGLAAVVVAPAHPASAAALLTVALGTSGVGLAFVAGTAVHLLLRRPRALVWLVLPVGLYLAWYLTFGSDGIRAHRAPSLDGVVEYVTSGMTAAAAGALGSTLNAVGIGVLAAIVVGLVVSRPVPRVALGVLAASVAFFGIAGLVRAQLGAEYAAQPRYVYIGGPGVLIAGAVLLARLPHRLGVAVGAVVLAVSLVGNIGLMVAARDKLAAAMECERQLIETFGSAGNVC